MMCTQGIQRLSGGRARYIPRLAKLASAARRTSLGCLRDLSGEYTLLVRANSEVLADPGLVPPYHVLGRDRVGAGAGLLTGGGRMAWGSHADAGSVDGPELEPPELQAMRLCCVSRGLPGATEAVAGRCEAAGAGIRAGVKKQEGASQ